MGLVDLLEVRVGKGLLGRDTEGGVHDEHLLEEVEARRTKRRNEGLEVLGLEAGEGVGAVVGQTLHSFPRRVVGCSHDLKDLVDLVDF